MKRKEIKGGQTFIYSGYIDPPADIIFLALTSGTEQRWNHRLKNWGRYEIARDPESLVVLVEDPSFAKEQSNIPRWVGPVRGPTAVSTRVERAACVLSEGSCKAADCSDHGLISSFGQLVERLIDDARLPALAPIVPKKDWTAPELNLFAAPWMDDVETRFSLLEFDGPPTRAKKG